MSSARQTPTPQRILEAALALFNRKGSVDVTTHDVAAACGISPGNLYYHYRNKEAIVRALFDEAVARHREREAARSSQTEGTTDADDLAFLKEFNWRYRFFKRELPTLLQRDRRLRAAFLAFQDEHLDRLTTAVGRAAACGDLRPLALRERRMLAEVSWLVLLFWPSYVELRGRMARGDMDRAVDVVQWLFARAAAPSRRTPTTKRSTTRVTMRAKKQRPT